MRKRTAAVGTGAVGLAAFGLWWLQDLGDFGLGGDGGGPMTLTVDPTAPDADADPAPAFPTTAGDDAAETELLNPAGTAPKPGGAGRIANAPADAPPMSMADVTVDGGEYWVVTSYDADGRPTREPMTAAEIVSLTAAVPGDPSGVKVRVSRTPDAEAGAVDDLMADLSASGLIEDQIDYRTRLLEDGAFGDDPAETAPSGQL